MNENSKHAGRDAVSGAGRLLQTSLVFRELEKPKFTSCGPVLRPRVMFRWMHGVSSDRLGRKVVERIGLSANIEHEPIAVVTYQQLFIP